MMTNAKNQSAVFTKIILTSCVVFLIALVFAQTRTHFIRPVEDLKELILVMVTTFLAFVYLSHLFFVDKQIKITPLTIGGFLYIGFWLVRSLFLDFSLNESFVELGQILLIFLSICCVSFLPKDMLIKLLLIFVVVIFFAAFFSHQEKLGYYLPIGHISFFSNVMMFCLPVLFYFLVTEKKWFWQLLFLAMAVYLAYKVFFLQRRTAFLAIVFFVLANAGLMLVLKRHMQNRQIFLKFLKVFLFFVFCLGSIYFVAINQENELNTKNVSQQNTHAVTRLLSLDPDVVQDKKEGRLTIWSRSFEAWQQRKVFGWGLGSFRYIYFNFFQPTDAEPSENRWMYHAHNEIISQFVEGGLVGGLFFLLLVSTFLFFVGRHFIELFRQMSLKKKSTSWQDVVLQFNLFCVLCAIAITFLFDTSSIHPLIRFVLVIFAGGLLAFIKIPQRSYLLTSGKKNSVLITAVFIFVGFFSCVTMGGKASSYFLRESLMQPQKNDHRIAQKLAPGLFQTLAYSAQVELIRDHYSPAGRELLLEAVKKFPYVPRIHLLLTQNFIDHQQFDQARHHLMIYKTKYPKSPLLQKLELDLPKK